MPFWCDKLRFFAFIAENVVM